MGRIRIPGAASGVSIGRLNRAACSADDRGRTDILRTELMDRLLEGTGV
jgi:hypothetical protein